LFKTILEQLCPQKALPFSFKDIVLPKIPKKEIRILSREEEKRLISLLTQKENRYSLGILLALFTGMRIGEVCALRWRDISLSQQMIQVNATIQRIKNTDLCGGERTKILVDSPKSTSSIRCIPLTTFTTALLQKYKCDDPNAFLLSGSANRCVEPRGLQYYLKKYTTMLDLAGVHFHTLRHTFASRCAEVAFEIKSLSEVLGHSDPKITLERYIHPSLECKRTNMEKLSVYGY